MKIKFATQLSPEIHRGLKILSAKRKLAKLEGKSVKGPDRVNEIVDEALTMLLKKEKIEIGDG